MSIITAHKEYLTVKIRSMQFVERAEIMPVFSKRASVSVIECNYALIPLIYAGCWETQNPDETWKDVTPKLINSVDMFHALNDKAAYRHVIDTYVNDDRRILWRGRLFKRSPSGVAIPMQYWDRKIGWTWFDAEKDNEGFIEYRTAPLG